MSQPPIDRLPHLVAMKAGRVGQIRLKQDVVRPDRRDMPWLQLLEPLVGVHLAPEVLRREHLELGPVLGNLGPLEVIIGGLQDERDPPDAGLDADKAKLGVTSQHTGEKQVVQLHPWSRNTVVEARALCAHGPSARTRSVEISARVSPPAP
jgi:hypothetical protein